MLSREQIDFLLTNAFNAALRAGSRIIEIYENPEHLSVSLKSDNTPFTLADAEAHRIISESLQPCRLPILSEEGRDMLYEERAGWDLFWMVDPLDGTDEFLQRNGEFTVNIALISAGKPLFGVIYIPTRGDLYFSDPDRGSFVRNEIFADESSDLGINEIFKGATRLKYKPSDSNMIRLATSRSHESASLRWFKEKISEQYADLEELECGSSMKFCMVAQGTVDFYPRTTDTYEWDTAAGEAIVKGAGLQILSTDGKPLAYNKESLVNPAFICGANLGALIEE